MQHVFIQADPPAPSRKSHGGHRNWSAHAAILRSRRGQWHKIVEDASPGYVSAIRNGKVGEFSDAERWEVVSRGNDIFIRYVGPSEVDYWAATD